MVLGLTGLVVMAQAGRNAQVRQYNLAGVVTARVLDHPARDAWFRSHGIPEPAAGVRALAPAPRLDALLQDERFTRWARGPALRVYGQYLVTHPSYAVGRAWSAMVGRDPGATRYGEARTLLPSGPQAVLFTSGDTGVLRLVAGLPLLGLYAVSRWRRRRSDVRLGLAIALFPVGGVGLLVAYHGAASELGRLSVVPALLVHLALLLAAAYTWDAVERSRDQRKAG